MAPAADTAETRLQLSELSEDLVLPTLAPRGRGTSYASALEALHHPHIHFVVPGGGIGPNGQWVPCRPGFFLP